MSDEEDKEPIVIDNGSKICKAGFAGVEVPEVTFDACVCRQGTTGDNKREFFVGYGSQNKREVASISYPIDRGIVTNWNDMEKIWNHIFHELHTSPTEQGVLLTEPPLNPKFNREMMAQVMFEQLQVPRMYVDIQCVLAMYSNGRVTGTMVESGDGLSHVVPMYEGHAIGEGIRRVDLGGRDVTMHLQRLLHQKGYSFVTQSELEIVQKIKEMHAYASIDYQADLMSNTTSLKESFDLPDGSQVTISHERYLCSEVMFDPLLIGLKKESIQQMLYKSLQSCDISTHRDLYNNIAISGGNTMMTGMKDRLLRELQKLKPHLGIRVSAPPERIYSVWLGGSILASLTNYIGMWTTIQQYQEYGPYIMHRRSIS